MRLLTLLVLVLRLEGRRVQFVRSQLTANQIVCDSYSFQLLSRLLETIIVFAALRLEGRCALVCRQPVDCSRHNICLVFVGAFSSWP